MEKKIEDYKHLYKGQQIEYYGPNLSKERLILRPLSSMTEEEAIELFKMEYSASTTVNWISIEMRKEDIRPFHEKLKIEPSYRVNAKYLLDNGKESGMSGSMSMKEFNSEQFTWLLSKGFDLFGLHEAGLCYNPHHVDFDEAMKVLDELKTNTKP